ncbi:hypothetical protein DASC09_012380 [Saccharomycopsis crataegensis]|uniref:BED-type domain-containing protein n=1 Tax=Saccharomycopsis crataegensis TaxID=43959 RepID=A0AAV5QID2_9ASCO|nr:hypothetical protein DASC09_012380 [Saccharomycopsis crataegensis]
MEVVVGPVASTIKNWKDFVSIDNNRSKKVKNQFNDKYFSCDAYTCKFCDHEFTYYSRNGPRTIIKHLQRHHPNEIYAAEGMSMTSSSAAATAAAAVAAHHQSLNDPSMVTTPAVTVIKVDPHHNHIPSHEEEISSPGSSTMVKHLRHHNHNHQVVPLHQTNEITQTSSFNTDSLIMNDIQIKPYQHPGNSVTANDLELTVKAATKQWKFHFTYDEGKTSKLREERPDSRFLNEVYDCKYCVKQFIYCSRNGPGTLVKHLERFHLSEVLHQNPAIVKNSEMYNALKKTIGQNDNVSIDDADSLNKNGEPNSTEGLTSNDAVNLFENECLANLLRISKAAKDWKKHYVKNEGKTANLLSQASNNLSYGGDRHSKLNQEVYDCRYCGISKIYISRNGPKTLTKHLEKSHKKELLENNNIAPIFNTESVSDSRKRAAPDSLVHVPPDQTSNESHHIGATDLIEMALAGNLKRQKPNEPSQQSTEHDYSHSKFHEDIIKFLNENKLYIQVVKSQSFKNLIQNMRPDLVPALDDLKTLYSSFLHLMNNSQDDSDANNHIGPVPAGLAEVINAEKSKEKENENSKNAEVTMGIDNIATMTSSIENSITQHNLLNSS